MAACKRPPKSSIEHNGYSVKCASFKIVDFLPKEYASLSGDKKQNKNKGSEQLSTEVLSMSEIISAIDQIWDCANRLSLFQPKSKSNLNLSGYQKEDVLDGLDTGQKGRAPLLDGSESFQWSPVLQSKFEFLKVTQKISLFEPCNENCRESFFSRLLQGGRNLSNNSWKGNEFGIRSVGLFSELGNTYQWMKELVPAGLKYHLNSTEIGTKQIGECCIPGQAGSSTGACVSGTTNPASNTVVGGAECNSDSLRSKDLPLCDDSNLRMNTGVTSLLSDYLMAAQADNSVANTSSSSLYADCHVGDISSCASAREGWQHLINGGEVLESDGKQPHEFVTEEENRTVIPSSGVEKSHYAPARQQHAFAGALAGAFVSVCLHPVDTVKTVIQSCSTEQKSICYIGKSIVSERGFTGLYRGIASNIASSAPISAVYTFTYESVKGGCASVATSFIFTPSERIKQQMQVGSHYHNCWNAFVGVIRKGGLPSLYAGWGAVLCRNVPHSIIKFYAYESLKQMMLSSLQSGAQLNTLQTLVCGGVAGSTAAIFTTPFDVVKTRFQTQVPGSRSQYNNVFQALQEIAKQEGLKGLYRGLIPRLVMYMSQGALFFASYEFFKSLFSLEVPHTSTQRTWHKQKSKDGIRLEQSAFVSSSSSGSDPVSSSSSSSLRS
ncbi:uncharacterized protein LOC110812797 isoform X2 [Carica papaya]|uniref:uncharacterized protein LOC110812797 isoform X2 n=1 Tax=Carica papaya TaxID=3649 RepID=UPI000B8CF381|nr:uncharacterized protein LOC110812797 isoform X2 [Carica papaya]